LWSKNIHLYVLNIFYLSSHIILIIHNRIFLGVLLSNAIIIFAWTFETPLRIASLSWLCLSTAIEPMLDPFNRIDNFYGDLSGIISPDSLDMKSSLRGRSRNQFISVSLRKRITCGRSEFIGSRASRDYNDLNLYPRANCCSSPVRLFETLIYLLVGDNETISHLRVFLYFYLFFCIFIKD